VVPNLIVSSLKTLWFFHTSQKHTTNLAVCCYAQFDLDDLIRLRCTCVVIVVSSYHALSHGCYVLTSTGQRGWEILDTASQKVIMRNTMHDDTRFMFRLHTERAFNFEFRFDYRWIHLDQVDPENQISKNESNVTERYDILYECDI